MSQPPRTRPHPAQGVSPYFSGLGVEFSPPGVVSALPNPLLHEIGFLAKNSHWNYPSVLSPFWRIYYNLDGGHTIFVKDKAHELIPGRLFIIPAEVFLFCRGEHPVRHFWMAFSLPNRWVDREQPIPIELEPTAEEAALIDAISHAIEEHPDGPDKESVYHQGMAILHLLLARLNILWKPEFPESFSRLLEFIDQHAHEAIPNRTLARQAGMSIPTLCRAFQSYLHTTPANYVSQVRIRRAARLLTQSELGMEEIAEQAGFPNRAYFSRIFKKVTTLSPAEFRKRKALHRLETAT